MRWTIGMDLRPSGRGALAFASWMLDRALASSNLTFEAVHVLEESFLLQELRHTHLADLEAKVMARALGALEDNALRASVTPRLVEGVHAEEVLATVVEGGSDAILIGRRLGSHEEGLIRLGRVARRLARSLPAPLVVVPGDLRRSDFGSGPIIVATDLTERSAGAARFAREVAKTIGRSLVVVHVVSTFDPGAMFVPSATVEQLYEQLGLAKGKELEAWIERNGLQDSTTALATGDVVSRVMGIAAQEESPLIVCGSRRMSTSERIFNASVGSSLAAFGETPIAIVPPDVV